MTHEYTILHGGVVLTMAGGRPSDDASRTLQIDGIDDACGRRATAIAVAGDRIIAVGSDPEILSLAGPESTVVDLRGLAVLPGFHDPHAHPLGEGLLAAQPSLLGTPDLRAALRALGAAASRLPPDAWLEARYLDVEWPERRHPTRDELDRAVPDRPVLLHHVSGHAAVANSFALALAGITAASQDVPGRVDLQRDEHGEPTGLIRGSEPFSPFAAALPSLAAEAARDALVLVSRRLAAAGVTSVAEADLGVVAAPIDELAAYGGAVIDGAFRQQLWLLPGLARLAAADEDPPTPDDLRALIPSEAASSVRIDTAKLYADGALTVRDAWLRAPYSDDPGTTGHAAHPPGALAERIARSLRAGWRIATHAIGDAGIEATLAAYDAAGVMPGAAGGGLAAPPTWRIEHAVVLPADLIERARRQGVTIVTQPEFVVAGGDAYLERLGEDRRDEILPYAAILAAGVPLAFSSDRPVTGGAPLDGIGAALRHAGPSGRRLSRVPAPSVAECLHAWTAAGAFVLGDGGESGQLAEGFRADLVILSGDPTAVDVEAWRDGSGPEVVATMLGGRLVHGELEPLRSSGD